MGLLNLTIGPLTLVLSDRFGVLTDKIKRKSRFPFINTKAITVRKCFESGALPHAEIAFHQPG